MLGLAEVRQEIMNRVAGVISKVLDFRNSLDTYAYLWVDDRAEFMKHFLLYGQTVSAEELDALANEEIPEQPPTLGQFREQAREPFSFECASWLLIELLELLFFSNYRSTCMRLCMFRWASLMTSECLIVGSRWTWSLSKWACWTSLRNGAGCFRSIFWDLSSTGSLLCFGIWNYILTPDGFLKFRY